MRKQKGFTLIELGIAVGFVVAILAGIGCGIAFVHFLVKFW